MTKNKEEEKAEESVQENLSLISPHIYAVIKREGEEELSRPTQSLIFSGLAAGLIMPSCFLMESLLHHVLEGSPSQRLIENFGYCVGFVIVIFGRLQLFTENTITAVLPLLSSPPNKEIGCLKNTARLWFVTLFANIAGTIMVAFFLRLGIVSVEFLPALEKVAQHFADKTFFEAFAHGIPAGFFVATIVWMLPTAQGAAKFWIVVLMTYLIALGDFSHIIVGSSELFFLLFAGETDIVHVLTLLSGTLVGNVLGGTGLFAMLAYAQVQGEID